MWLTIGALKGTGKKEIEDHALILGKGQALDFISANNFNQLLQYAPSHEDEHFVRFIEKRFVNWASFDANELTKATSNTCDLFFSEDQTYQQLFSAQTDLKQILLFNEWLNQTPFEQQLCPETYKYTQLASHSTDWDMPATDLYSLYQTIINKGGQ